jgi:hypothetical protein
MDGLARDWMEVEAGDGYGLWDGVVEKDSGEGGGSGMPEEVPRKWGVPRGEGRSGSMRRLALREVKNAGLG